jgi:hypothetical protein
MHRIVRIPEYLRRRQFRMSKRCRQNRKMCRIPVILVYLLGFAPLARFKRPPKEIGCRHLDHIKRVKDFARITQFSGKYDMFLRAKYFIVVEGFNPRIHALYFCPQLFRHDSDKLVPLEGEEIGELIARAVEATAAERRPWYEPMERLPQQPLINTADLGEFDTLVVEMPRKRESLPAAGQQVLGRPSQPAKAS